ncbi:MAG: hypothetical protein M3R04_01345 [bacterium]|nr:hypothetical protein [bacterium]
MSRLIAGVIALAVFVAGSMYWSRAEQLNSMPAQPLCPGVTCADKAVTQIDNASAVAPEASATAKSEGCEGKSCSEAKDGAGCADKSAKNGCGDKESCCPGKDKSKTEKTVDA